MNYYLSSNSHIFKFSKENTPSLRVSSGDIIEIETFDCFSNQVQTSEDRLDCIDWDRVNPATGPIYINDAEPGDVLVVSILKVSLNNQGVMASGKDLGVLGEKLEGLSSKLIQIENNTALFNSDLSIPLNPMIGVIGVAPAGEAVNTGTPGAHGGNMDNKMVAEGSTLYFPIFSEGALFALGDLHAAMGDGEIGVTGIEIPGKVTVRLEVKKGLTINNPILENEKYFSTIASDISLDKAVSTAVEDMFELLAARLPIKKDELAMLLSAVGSTEICQVVDPLKTARFVFPKWILNKYNFKL